MEDPRIPLDDDLSPEGWKERVRDCFEVLRSRQEALAVETMDGVQMEGRIESLDDTKGRMVLSIPRATSAGLSADDEVRLLFSMHESRWVGRAKVHYHNDRRNRFTLILPNRLDPSDRRREQRVFLDTAENIKATFRPAGFEGVEVTGRLSNLSESGFRMAVETALDIDRRRPLDPGDVPLEENQILEAMRISGLRETLVEAEGIALEVDPQPLGPILGVRFRFIAPEDREFLRSVVSARAQTAPPVIPSPRFEPAQATTDPETIPFRLPEPEASPNHAPQAELRLKRFRTLALVMPQGPEQEAIRNFLATQGFTRVLPAGTLSELAVLARKSPPDVFFVDWPGTIDSELDIALFLGNHPFPAPPRIIMACTHATTQLAREANRLGVSQLLVKPYPLDDTLVELILQQFRGDEF
jgi:hypothetical protein